MDLRLPLDYSAIERILPHRIPFLLVDRVTEFEPDRRLSLRGSLGPFHGDVTYQLAPAGSGTALTSTMNLQPSGPLRLLAPLASSRVKSAVATNLDTLKQILETGGPPADR